MTKERSLYWDTLKGFLIVLVVFGHCGTAVGDNLLSVVYSFHMPLFVLISGFFSKKADMINRGGYKRLIFIYLVFNFAYASLDYLLNGISFYKLLIPSFGMWYLLSLIFWRLMLQYLPQCLLDRKVLMLTLVIVIAIFVGFIPINTELSFQRTFVFFPFFISGYYLKLSDMIGKIRKCNKVIASICVAALLVLSYLFLPVMYANSSYSIIPNDLYTRSVQLLIAFILCFGLLVLGLERIPLITNLGKYTLLIYVLHPPIIKFIKVLCVKVGYQPNLLIAIIITIMTVSLIYSIRKIKLVKYLL